MIDPGWVALSEFFASECHLLVGPISEAHIRFMNEFTLNPEYSLWT